MGIFGKLKFWGKKETDFPDRGLGLPPLEKGASGDFGAGEVFGVGSEMGFGEKPLGGENEFMQHGVPVSQPSYQQQSFGQPSFGAPQQLQQPQYAQPETSHYGYIAEKNMEIVSSKLDAIRAALESINQRLVNIERIAHGEQEKRRW